MPLLRFEVWQRCELSEEPDPENEDEARRVADLHGLLIKHASRKKADMRARQVAAQEGECFVHDRETGRIQRYEKPRGGRT